MGTSNIEEGTNGKARELLPATEGDEQSNKSLLAYGLWLLGGTLAIFVLYMSSVGPAAWLHKKGYFRKGIELVYVPAESLYKASPTPIKSYLDRYVDFWTKHV